MSATPPPEPLFSATRVLQGRSAHVVMASPGDALVTAAGRPHPRSPPRALTSWQATLWIYHWLVWFVLVILLAVRFSCAFWDSSTRYEAPIQGQAVADGFHDISAEAIHPEPYVDRAIVCVLNGGRQYEPWQLTRALARPSITVDEPPSTISGYRVVRRSTETVLSTSDLGQFSNTCSLLAWTLDAILDSCTTLGYNVTRDYLRVVDGRQDTAVARGVTDSLPVLIEPLDDGTIRLRFHVPGEDGSSCGFRLLGRYEDPSTTSSMILRGVTRSIHESKTLELMRGSGANQNITGVWKNGWLETSDGSRWHSEVISTVSVGLNDTYGMQSRIFDTEANKEMNASTTTSWPLERSWGDIASSCDTLLWFHSIIVSNGNLFGMSRVESSQTHLLRTSYPLETLLADLSITWVLLRWAITMVAHHRGYQQGYVETWRSVGLGSVACMRGFHFLPFVLLPRLKTTLAVFWTVGCAFTGEQRAVSEAWFVMYPAIAELVVFHFSIVNVVAKLLRRRVSDVLFAPTLTFFCVLHLIREFVFPTPLESIVSSSELKSLSLFSFVSTPAAMRINGNVKWLVYLKLTVLLSLWLPLVLFANRNTTIRKRSQATAGCRVEKTVALRASHLGGLGLSDVYDVHDTSGRAHRTAVVPFELLRMGYVVVGGSVMLGINDWLLLLVLTPWRRKQCPPNFRVALFKIEVTGSSSNVTSVNPHPELVRLNDPRLQAVEMLDITMMAML